MSTTEALQTLSAFKSIGTIAHQFWPDDLSLRDESLFNSGLITGPGKLTDLYLLGLAHRHGGKLVSFDRTLPWRAVHGAGSRLVENPADTLKT